MAIVVAGNNDPREDSILFLRTINLTNEESDHDVVPSLIDDDDSFATTLTLSTYSSSLFFGGDPCNLRLAADITQLDVIRMGKAAAEYIDGQNKARHPIVQYDAIIQEDIDRPHFGRDLELSIEYDASHNNNCSQNLPCQTEPDPPLSFTSDDEENSEYHRCDSSSGIGCTEERCVPASSSNFASCNFSSCGSPHHQDCAASTSKKPITTGGMAREEDDEDSSRGNSSSFASWAFVKIGSLLETDRADTIITSTTMSDSEESDSSIIPHWSFLQIGEALESQEHLLIS